MARRAVLALALTVLAAGCGDDGVEEAEPPDEGGASAGISLVIDGEGPFAPGDTVSAHVENDSRFRLSYGACPELERREDEAWVPAREEPVACIAIAYEQPSGVPGQELNALIPPGAEPGTYRLVHEVSRGRRTLELTAQLAVVAEP